MGRYILLVVIVALSLQACSGPRIRTVDVAPFTGSDRPSGDTDLSLGEQEREDGQFLGLALSGGGSRAAVFGAAVMRELQARSVLSRVDVISAVSGGALPATMYALDGRQGIRWDDRATELLAADFQGDVIARIANPLHWPRYWFTSYSRGDDLESVLDTRLFHGAHLSGVAPNPRLLINATNALTGEPFVFTPAAMARVGLSQAELPVTRAISASTAYPDTLPLVRFRAAAATAASNTPSSLTLYDGGVADNLGVGTLLTLLDTADRERALSDQFPQGCLIIAVDATPRSPDTTPLSAAAGLLRNNRRQMLARVGLSPSEQDREAVTTFAVGPQGGRCMLWHVALRHLGDESLGRRATSIPTNLRLSADDRTVLEQAAHQLVERSWPTLSSSGAPFHRFVESARQSR
ncbi:MAG: patatin-like phospholipase family protein [Nitrospiraceae bacterium]